MLFYASPILYVIRRCPDSIEQRGAGQPARRDPHPDAPRGDRPAAPTAADGDRRRRAAADPARRRGRHLRPRPLGVHPRGPADRGEPLMAGRDAARRGAARAPRGARARAPRADRARQRRARRGPGPQLLARPLARRPERADAPARRERGRARRCGGTRRWSSAARASRARARSIPHAGRRARRRRPSPAGARPRPVARTISPDPLFAAPVTELLHARLDPARGRGDRGAARPERGAQLAAAIPPTGAVCCSPSPPTTRWSRRSSAPA